MWLTARYSDQKGGSIWFHGKTVDPLTTYTRFFIDNLPGCFMILSDNMIYCATTSGIPSHVPGIYVSVMSDWLDRLPKGTVSDLGSKLKRALVA